MSSQLSLALRAGLELIHDRIIRDHIRAVVQSLRDEGLEGGEPYVIGEDCPGSATFSVLKTYKEATRFEIPSVGEGKGNESLPSIHVGTSSGLRTTMRASAATPTLTSSLRTISSCSSKGSCQARGQGSTGPY